MRIILLRILLVLFLTIFGGGPVSGEPVQSRGGRFTDNGDGTVTDTKSGLIWVKEDSWVQQGKCLRWQEAGDYIQGLEAGGHRDWRLPTMDELAGWPNGVVERSKTSSIGVEFRDWQEKYTLALDPVFGPRAAYWIWSSETDGERRAGMVDMRTGQMLSMERDKCFVMGVRGVRQP